MPSKAFFNRRSDGRLPDRESRARAHVRICVAGRADRESPEHRPDAIRGAASAGRNSSDSSRRPALSRVSSRRSSRKTAAKIWISENARAVLDAVRQDNQAMKARSKILPTASVRRPNGRSITEIVHAVERHRQSGRFASPRAPGAAGGSCPRKTVSWRSTSRPRACLTFRSLSTRCSRRRRPKWCGGVALPTFIAPRGRC